MRSSTIDKHLLETVLEAYKRSYSVQSDYARANAEYVAMAASIGYISTKVYGNVFSRDWRPTVKGLTWLEKIGESISDDTWTDAPLEHEAMIDEP
jgi:hypothetical protein